MAVVLCWSYRINKSKIALFFYQCNFFYFRYFYFFSLILNLIFFLCRSSFLFSSYIFLFFNSFYFCTFIPLISFPISFLLSLPCWSFILFAILFVFSFLFLLLFSFIYHRSLSFPIAGHYCRLPTNSHKVNKRFLFLFFFSCYYSNSDHHLVFNYHFLLFLMHIHALSSIIKSPKGLLFNNDRTH